MSLETLLEAAEFLEWSKSGKKVTSRETRTSKRAEKFQPYVLSERKKKLQQSKASGNRAETPDAQTSPGPQRGKNKDKVSDVKDTPDDEEDNNSQDSEDTDLATEAPDETELKDIKRCLGTRETHNKLEKNRRAHLKECFEQLRKELPGTDDRRTSNLATLRSALRYIDHLINQHRELENEKRRMQRCRNSRQAHVNSLKKELKEKGIEYNIDDWIRKEDEVTSSTNTASEWGDSTKPDQGVAGDTPVTQQGFLASNATTITKPTDALQLVIKAMPPIKTKQVSGAAGTGHQMLDKVTVEAPPQAIQMIQQAAIKASSHQRLRLQIAPANSIASVPTHQTAQVVAVTNIPPPTASTSATAPKIMITPKQPVVASTSTIPLGQVLVSNPGFMVSQVHQAIPVSTAGAKGPVTLSIQPAGKVLTPRPAYVTTATSSTALASKPYDSSHLSIAPKQLVLITADQQRLRTAPILSAVSSAPTQPVTNQIGQLTLAQPLRSDHVKVAAAQPLSNILPITALGDLQAVKPTIITGMMPTTAADGSVSYVPVTLTTKPFNNGPIVNTSFVNGGLTLVLPSSSAQPIHNIQVAPKAPAVAQTTAGNRIGRPK